MRTPTQYEAADGKITWRVRFRNGHGRDAPQASETFDDEDAAIDFAKELDVLGPKLALERLYVSERDPNVPTMDVLAGDHIKYLTGIEDGTREKYTRIWNHNWSPHIGRFPADAPDMRDRISDATNANAAHYARKSLANQRGLLAAVCDRAVEKGYMPANPTKKLRLPEGRPNTDADSHEDDDHEMRLIEQGEFNLLVDAMSPRYRLLVKFLGGTGCRWGEVVVLRKLDFTLDPPSGNRMGPVVRIRRALKYNPNGSRKIGGPKSKKSKRTIAIPRELVPDMREHLAGLKPEDLVFTTAGGLMLQHRTFWSDHWRPAVWRARSCGKHVDPACRCGTAHPERCKVHDRIPEPCGCPGTLSVQARIHDTRHSHASWLLAAGIPIHVVQIRLGHESIKTTVDTYGHLLPDAQLAAAEAAGAAFAELSPAAKELEIQRELAGLDQLLSFLAGDEDLPPALVAALEARGWTRPKLMIEP